MSYSITCNWKNAFVTNPPHQCYGYLTDFNGLGLSAALAKVILPWGFVVG